MLMRESRQAMRVKSSTKLEPQERCLYSIVVCVYFPPGSSLFLFAFTYRSRIVCMFFIIIYLQIFLSFSAAVQSSCINSAAYMSQKFQLCLISQYHIDICKDDPESTRSLSNWFILSKDGVWVRHAWAESP